MKPALNLPNQITIGRLFLAMAFFALLSRYVHRTPNTMILDVACVMYIVAAVTDILDGYIARSRGLVTPLGRVLDPLVDKVLVCGTFILFSGPAFVDATGYNVTEVRPWMVVLIVGRELLVTGLRGFNESVGKSFGASLSGKLKMWMQSIAAPTILFIIAREQDGWLTESASSIKAVLVWLTVIITALSMVHYMLKSRHILDESAPA